MIIRAYEVLQSAFLKLKTSHKGELDDLYSKYISQIIYYEILKTKSTYHHDYDKLTLTVNNQRSNICF